MYDSLYQLYIKLDIYVPPQPVGPEFNREFNESPPAASWGEVKRGPTSWVNVINAVYDKGRDFRSG